MLARRSADIVAPFRESTPPHSPGRPMGSYAPGVQRHWQQLRHVYHNYLRSIVHASRVLPVPAWTPGLATVVSPRRHVVTVVSVFKISKPAAEHVPSPQDTDTSLQCDRRDKRSLPRLPCSTCLICRKQSPGSLAARQSPCQAEAGEGGGSSES